MALIDEVVPRHDVHLRHAAVFRAPADEVFREACGLDVLRHPLIRVLVAARALPLRGRGPAHLRIMDLAGPSFGWLPLAERRGRELVLGMVARPWQVTAPPPQQPTGPTEFAAFAEPGHVKIILGVRVLSDGPGAAVLELETRVAATDAGAARRFRRYWRVVGPFSELLRDLAMRMLARDLDPGARNSGELVIARSPEVVFDAVADERVEPHYNPDIHDVELLTAEPLGVGTRFRATAGTTEMTIECTAYDRPRRFDSATRMAAMDIDYTLFFEPVDAGTRMHWRFDLHPRGVLRRLRPLVDVLGRRQERRNWATLREYLETRPGGPPDRLPDSAGRRLRRRRSVSARTR